jgi:hypothetical protein
VALLESHATGVFLKARLVVAPTVTPAIAAAVTPTIAAAVTPALTVTITVAVAFVQRQRDKACLAIGADL